MYHGHPGRDITGWKPVIHKMIGNAKKVFVALSGGVDSSAAAVLLCQGGFDCAGVFMITSPALPKGGTSGQATDGQGDAERIAEKLGIRLYVLDLRGDFERILDYFCSEYKKGRTPNPCAICNRYIKFGKLWDFARGNGAEFFATGHYARIIEANRNVGLYEAADGAKDQSYALAMIKRDVLGHIIFPMGEHSKETARETAAKFGLELEQKKESQEICFIPDDDYVSVLEEKCPELVCKGDIIDSNGRVLGEHKGVHRFTIGQRRGLRVAMGSRYYVARIDAETNTVTLGPKEEVMHRKLSATGVNWLADKPQSAFRAKVKIRYNDKGASAMVSPQDDGAFVEFDEPVSAITPGQLAVFYIQNEFGGRVVGGGWIDKISD